MITIFASLMIPAKKNKIIAKLFSVYHKRLLKNHFYAVHLYGLDNIKQLQSGKPVILYSNHSNWWDGFIAYLITNRLLKKDDYLMMDIEQMKKYPFFKYVGVFSVNRQEPKDAVNSINYAAELLKNRERYFWIFPEGEMNPQDKRPLKFYSGITKIAQKLGDVYLLPVCFRYEFMMEQRPEVFISIGNPDTFSGSIDTAYLQNKLESHLNELRENVITKNLAGFKTVFHGKDSRNKTFD